MMGDQLTQSLNYICLDADNPISIYSGGCPCCTFYPPDSFQLPSKTIESSLSLDGQSKNLETEPLMSSPLQIMQKINQFYTASNTTKTRIDQKTITIVDTHSHAHLDRKPILDYNLSTSVDEEKNRNSENFDYNIDVVSLICAISPNDWERTIDYVSKSSLLLPALGVHPWYIEDTFRRDHHNEKNEAEKMQVQNNYLRELESLLLKHPSCFVGEIGLCQSAKNIRFHPNGKKAGLQQQMQFFEEQFRLAAKLQRGVTIHCVGYHKEMLKILISIRDEVLSSSASFDKNHEEVITNVQTKLKESFPPVMSFHSFSGSAHFVNEILSLEESILFPNKLTISNNTAKKESRKKKSQFDPKAAIHAKSNESPMFYFGFSHYVNVSMISNSSSTKSQQRNKLALQAIPLNRVLIESDLSNSKNALLGTVGATGYLSQILGKSLEKDILPIMTENGLRFLNTGIRLNSL